MKVNEKNNSVNVYATRLAKIFHKANILILLLGLGQGFHSCTEFIEVDVPQNILISETVFEDPATVESALANIYFKMREEGMVSGRNGQSDILGAYSDELDYYLFDTNVLALYQHNVLATNTILSGWWNDAYALIYAANDIIEGMENSKTLTSEEKELYKGQALFVRGYLHSLLVGLYGQIPYITTPDYLENNVVDRMPTALVYDNIIADISEAVGLLEEEDATGERVIPNRPTAQALLARIYLYTENWEMAALTAGQLIASYELEEEVADVFLKDASSTIWQFKPNGISDQNTYEANQFIIQFIPGQIYALTDKLLNAFETGDLRRSDWVGSTSSEDSLVTLYYPNKYKATFSVQESLEYSIVFRLEEQYLIRAEARARLNNLTGSRSDLNTIRNRAALPNTTAATKAELITAILQERAVELFTEHGHRWLDLKRTETAGTALSPIKANWSDTDVLLPLPSSELELNPNLKPQNPGY